MCVFSMVHYQNKTEKHTNTQNRLGEKCSDGRREGRVGEREIDTLPCTLLQHLTADRKWLRKIRMVRLGTHTSWEVSIDRGQHCCNRQFGKKGCKRSKERRVGGRTNGEINKFLFQMELQSQWRGEK